MRKNYAKRYHSKFAFLIGLGLLSQSHALAAGPVPHSGAATPVPDLVLNPADQALSRDVMVMENRFFFHSYGHDPLEKRLERLELLTLGGAQPGSNAERLARLKLAVVARDKAAAKTIASEQKSEGESSSTSAA